MPLFKSRQHRKVSKTMLERATRTIERQIERWLSKVWCECSAIWLPNHCVLCSFNALYDHNNTIKWLLSRTAWSEMQSANQHIWRLCACVNGRVQQTFPHSTTPMHLQTTAHRILAYSHINHRFKRIATTTTSAKVHISQHVNKRASDISPSVGVVGCTCNDQLVIALWVR